MSETRAGSLPPFSSAERAALAADLRTTLGNLVRRLREATKPGDLTMSQIAVIGRLDREGPSTVSSLARAEGVRPQSMGATVAALEQAGLVRGLPDPQDGRQTILSLTDACHELVRKSRAAREDWLSDAIDRKLDPSEQRALAGALDLLRRLGDR